VLVEHLFIASYLNISIVLGQADNLA